MRRLSAVSIGIIGAVLPALALAAAPSNPLTLHDRIVARYDGTIEADPVSEMATDRALIAEAEATRDIRADDRARLKMLLGLALTHAQRFADAVREVDAGIAILADAGQGGSPLSIELMMNGASFLGDAGDRDGAANRLDQVLSIQTKLFGPDSSEAGFTYGFIGYNALQQGRLAAAIDAMQKSLARMRPDPASKVAVAAHYETYAHMLGMSGRTSDYLAAARVAVKVAQTTLEPGQRGISLTLTDLATALQASGRYAEAEAVARQAVAINVKYRGRNNVDTALALSRVAESVAIQGHAEEAEGLLLEAAEIRLRLRSTVEPKEPARFLIRAAALARSRGDVIAAQQRLARAFTVLGTPTKGDELIRFLGAIEQARNLLIDQDYSAALVVIDAGLLNARELTPTSARRIEGEMLRALILTRLGRASEAIDYATPIAQLMETHLLDNTVPTGETISLAPSYAHAFGEYASIALAAEKDDTAFRAIQLANLSELAITYSAVAARSTASDPALAALTRSLQDELAKRDRLDHERSFALSKSAGEVSRIDFALAEQNQVTAALFQTLDTRFPQYRSLARPSPVALSDVVSSLPSKSAVLAPIVLDDSIVSVAVTSRGLSWHSTFISHATVDEAVGSLRRAVEPGATTNGFPVGQAALLYRALLPDQLTSQIGRRADLLYFGGGALSRIPLAILVKGGPMHAVVSGAALRSVAWLVRDHSIETIGTFAGLIARRREKPGGVLPGGFAGIGAPILAAIDPGSAGQQRLRGGVIASADLKLLPSLPGAAIELGLLRKKLGRRDSLLLVGNEANERRVRSVDLMPYSIIAFATHGVVSGDNGSAEPALVLTPPDQASDTDDGLLTASEASRLRLDADWVILSNCDSAGAGDSGAAPYSGLARAFFQAGARALLVSMWPVRDDAAEQLTVRTVDPKDNLGRAHALQAAELAALSDSSIRDGGHPAVWAPFVLVER